MSPDGGLDPDLDARLMVAPIIVDHTSLGLFEQIPEAYLQRARNLRMIFGNRSVGVNTSEALDCLSFDSDEVCWTCRVPGACARQCNGSCVDYTHDDPAYSSPPSSVDWARDGGYDRSNWVHESFYDTWSAMLANYCTLLDGNQVQGSRSLNDFDVYTFQFSYLNVTDLDQGITGIFQSIAGDKNDLLDLDSRVVSRPGKVFVYQTASLARTIGTSVSTTFNANLRTFAQTRDSLGRYRVLLDFADIEAHSPSGAPCVDSRDGVCWCRTPPSSGCEDYTMEGQACSWDDGVQHPAICQHYTTELTNGHLVLGTIKVRIAKAYWILMAQLAGWQP
ncbi:MAG: hypothetical protein AMXMBFR34_43360 [Myxococcaceae bacterium]